MAQYSTTNDDYDFVLDNMPAVRDCQNNDGPTPLTNLGILLIFFILDLFLRSIAKTRLFEQFLRLQPIRRHIALSSTSRFASNVYGHVSRQSTRFNLC